MIVATTHPLVSLNNLAVGTPLGIGQTQGIQLVPSIPSYWKHRQNPQPLKRTDVGPK